MSALTPLPIELIKAPFCQALTEHRTVILSAPPGAGKSTCLPLWLLNFGGLGQHKIYLLQPRRLAVKNIATYLASQLNEPVGKTIGYRLRNETKISKDTRLEVITEGILTQIIQYDAELANCALVVFDEFHERSLHGDLAFALTRDVQQGLRDDLKILLMSATLDTEYLNKALPDAVTIESEGRSYPVEVIYNAPNNVQHWRAHALNVIKKEVVEHQGSTLVFLPGVADIRFIAQALSTGLSDEILLCPLFGDLTLKQQQQAIEPCQLGKRKLVLATNIAETSLTIEGVSLVIDCGLEKVASYDSASLMNKLVQKRIAKASAIQRAGRAGRLMAGKCIRLYAKDDFERRPDQGTNDIQQADLLPSLIEVARWGVNTLADLPLLELPTAIKEKQAWRELHSLAIIDQQNRLTKHGEQVAQLPCHPRFAHMLLCAKTNLLKERPKEQRQQLTLLACMITALLEERDIISSEHSRYDCDLEVRITQLQSQWHKPYGVLANIVKQVENLARKVQLADLNSIVKLNLELDKTGLLLACAYPERVAKARGSLGDFICANGKGVRLSDQDALAGEDFLVIADLMQAQGTLQVRLAARISLPEIEQVFTEDIVEQDIAIFDDASGKIIARSQIKLASLTLQEKVSQNKLTKESIAQMWCELVKQKGLDFLHWQEKDLALQARWQWLNDYFPQYGLPDISDKTLLANLHDWFAPFVGEIKSKTKLAKVDLSSLLLSSLDYQQQQILKQAAPSVFIGPTGRHCPIRYSKEKSPKVSLPMQELYGSTQTPSVGGVNNNQGIPLLLELLSPAQRPIQVTQDLAQFWAGSYQSVQKDMKSNYPRHFWPDDPANAEPTNKTKRHLTIKT